MPTKSNELIKTSKVDEKLYSRQLYVMGHDAQRRMMKSRVLVIGLSGLGVEIAKNCILAGVSVLILCDPYPTNSFDLGGNFYLSESDLMSGISRAKICAPKLAELNRYVTVEVADYISSFSINNIDSLLSLVDGVSVVVVSIPVNEILLLALNDRCRAKGICFITSVTAGVFGQIFCDFGDKFVVSDRNGEPAVQSQIETIFPSFPALVKVLEEQGRHGLETGDFVTFSRVKGLNGALDDSFKEYEVLTTGPYTFELVGLDLSTCTEPATQGYITQVKKSVTVTSRSLRETLCNPGEFMISDFSKVEYPALLHHAFRSLSYFAGKNGNYELPWPGRIDMMNSVWDTAKSLDNYGILKNYDDVLSSSIVRHLASGSRTILSPMCTALGGIVGQEVLKACSGKFTPIKGFLYLDAIETLPDTNLTLEEVTPTHVSRYDSQIGVFGRQAQKDIKNLNYFLIGAGAIGCEMLKTWALMGLGCGYCGQIFLTDMDMIEKSNLNRQFLFRTEHINQFKSAVAGHSALSINPDLNLTVYQEKVTQDTENIFGDTFYKNLDGISTALDNIEARLYVDQKCLFYRLPMLESGTLGTKGNTQVVVPHFTENYGATRDPPETSIPICTLKNFPNRIEHTLQWARDYFEGVFRQNAEDVNSYLNTASLDDYALFIRKEHNNTIDTLRSLRNMLVVERPLTFEDCVKWARHQFQELFVNNIRQLLHNFPPEQLSSKGSKFWSGSKRCPHPLEFDLDKRCDEARMRNQFNFFVAASNLRAKMFGIKGRTDEEYFYRLLPDIVVPEFIARDGINISVNDETHDDSIDNKKREHFTSELSHNEVEYSEILRDIPKPSELAGFKLNPIIFDKDVDEHMQFVTACSNLRAMNYFIPTGNTYQSRAIAGRIIPAIATTTALVSGLICLELYKLAGTARRDLSLSDYKNCFINLAIPFITFSEPSAPEKTKAVLKGVEWNWTAWDSIEIDKGDISLSELMRYFKTEYNLEISMLSHGVSILYSFFTNKEKVQERMNMSLSKIITSITRKSLSSNQLYLTLEIIANDLDTDEEVDIPFVRLKFR